MKFKDYISEGKKDEFAIVGIYDRLELLLKNKNVTIDANERKLFGSFMSMLAGLAKKNN